MAGKKGMKQTIINSPARIAEIRAKIDAIRIVNKLQNHLDGGVEMSSTQMKAAEILLRKCVPDVSAVTLETDPNNPIHVVTEIVRKIVK